MRSKLKEKGQNVPLAATYAQVLELYDSIVEKDMMSMFRSDVAKIQYPLLPSSALNLASKDIQVLLKTKGSDLGRALRDPSLSPKHVCGLVHLMGEMVRMDGDYTASHVRREQPVHKNTPDVLIRFAANARVHSGLRILKRSVRHAVDPKNPDIRDAEVLVGLYKDEVCLWISQTCKPSFKAAEYTTSCAFTSKDFLASQCNCRTGGKADQLNDDKHTCIHPPSKMYSFSLELFKGLAENALIELELLVASDSARFDAFTGLASDVCILMTAARYLVDSKHSSSLTGLLNQFRVGTAREKTAPGKPDGSMVRPIRELKFVNPTTMAAGIISGNAVSRTQQKSNKPSFPVPERSLEEEYIHVQSSIDGLVHFLRTKHPSLINKDADKSPIGRRLLKRRSYLALEKRNQNNHVAELLEYSTIFGTAVDAANSRCNPSAVKKKEACIVDRSPLGKRRLFESRTKSPEKWPHLSSLTDSGVAASSLDPFAAMPAKAWISEFHKRKKSRKIHAYCSVNGCKHNDSTAKLQDIPKRPKALPKGASKPTQITWHKNNWKRNEWTDRLGRGRKFNGRLRICSHHPLENQQFDIQCPIRIDGDGPVVETVRTRVMLKHLPKPIGPKGFESTPSSLSKGTAVDRYATRILRSDECDDRALGQQQQAEVEKLKAGEYDPAEMNPTVRKAAGLDVHSNNSLRPGLGDKKEAPKSAVVPPVYDQNPRVVLEDLVPGEVHRRTGFCDFSAMMAYALVLCGGDMPLLTQTSSRLTWIEEWVFYFEFVYGRTTIRWKDYSHRWGVWAHALRTILRAKLSIAVAARERWPRYASHEEDISLRDDYWNGIFPPSEKWRIIMHDMTNVPLMKSADPEIQRSTHNRYYNMNCAKGGIFTQTCGWEGTLELFAGHIEDSPYVEKTRIFEAQEEFAAADLVNNILLAFINIFDKGYRVLLQAQRAGKQLCLQPYFAESDKRYVSHEVLMSASIAAVRSGNERSVRHMKLSWVIKRGASTQPYDLDLLADMWLAWGFQVNFMYDAVH